MGVGRGLYFLGSRDPFGSLTARRPYQAPHPTPRLQPPHHPSARPHTRARTRAGPARRLGPQPAPRPPGPALLPPAAAGLGPSLLRGPLTSFGTSWFSSPGTIAQTPAAPLRPAGERGVGRCGGSGENGGRHPPRCPRSCHRGGLTLGLTPARRDRPTAPLPLPPPSPSPELSAPPPARGYQWKNGGGRSRENSGRGAPPSPAPGARGEEAAVARV